MAATIHMQIHQRLCIPCPAAGKQVWEAVETALGIRRVEFDLLVGNDHVPYCNVERWWAEEELDVTVVKRPTDVVVGLASMALLLSGSPRGLPTTGWTMQIHSLDFLKHAVAFFSGDILAHASPELQGNREAVLFSVKNCGRALKFANSALQDDHDVVKAAVQSCGGALAFASERLKNDTDLLLHLAMADDATRGQLGTERARNRRRIARIPPVKFIFFNQS